MRTWALYVRARAWVLTPAPQAMLKMGHLVIPLFDIIYVSQQLRVFYVDLSFHFKILKVILAMLIFFANCSCILALHVF